MRPESATPLAPPVTGGAKPRHRWRNLLSEAWRFSLVGFANVGINFVLFNALALTLFPGGELKANVIATAFATTTSYMMNRAWTFRHRRTTRIPREYVLFFAFNAAGLAIELAVMAAAKYGLGLTTLLALNLAKLAGLGLATVFRFWTYRTFVFAGRPDAAAAAAAAAADPALVDPDDLIDPDDLVDHSDRPDAARAGVGQPAAGTHSSRPGRPIAPGQRSEFATAPAGSTQSMPPHRR